MIRIPSQSTITITVSININGLLRGFHTFDCQFFCLRLTVSWGGPCAVCYGVHCWITTDHTPPTSSRLCTKLRHCNINLSLLYSSLPIFLSSSFLLLLLSSLSFHTQALYRFLTTLQRSFSLYFTRQRFRVAGKHLYVYLNKRCTVQYPHSLMSHLLACHCFDTTLVQSKPSAAPPLSPCPMH